MTTTTNGSTRPMVRASAEALVSAYREMQAHDIYPGMPTPLEFAQWFWDEEESRRFHIGCSDCRDRRALVYGVTALRFLCAVEHEAALELLRMAIAEIESVWHLKQAQS